MVIGFTVGGGRLGDLLGPVEKGLHESFQAGRAPC